MSRLTELINRGLGVLEEIGELDETAESNAISESYRKVIEDLERLKYTVAEEEMQWTRIKSFQRNWK
jgi:hypothetical protein